MRSLPSARLLHQPGWASLLTLLVGLLLTTGVTLQQASVNADRATRRFADLAERAANGVADRVERHAAQLQGASGAVAAVTPQALDNATFRRFVAAVQAMEADGIARRGLGVVWRVAAADRDAFETAARRDGPADFHIHGLSPNDGEAFVIRHVEPAGPNRVALGLDIASEPLRRHAALLAADTRTACLTAPIQLVQGSGTDRTGFLMLLPLAATPDGRVPGWVFAPLRARDLLAGLPVPRGHLQLTLTDVTDGNAARPFARTDSASPPAEGIAPVQIVQAVAGRHWAVDATPTVAFVDDLDLLDAKWVGIGGVLMSLFAALAAGWGARLQRNRHAVQAERFRLATVVENSPDAIVVQNLGGEVVSWNRAATALFGFTADEAVGQPLTCLILGPAYAEEDAQIRARAAAGEGIPTFDTIRQDRDGREIEVSVSVSIMCEPDGRIVGVAKQIRDARRQRAQERQLTALNEALERRVTERTQELSIARRDLQNVLDAVPSLIGYWDATLHMRVSNHACRAWYDVDPDAVIGTTLPELLGPELYARTRPFVEAALRGEAQTFEQTTRHPATGQVRHALAHYIPDLRDGAAVGFYAILHDVTALKNARAAAEAASAAKGAFLATMSHEIRTPLHAVIGSTELLEDTGLDPQQRTLVRRVQLASRSLLNIVNDVLDLARIEAGELAFDKVPFEVQELVDELTAVYGPQCEAKGLGLTVRYPGGPVPPVHGDAQKLRQILVNLIGNAIKFTQTGRVEVVVDHVDEVVEAIELRVQVIDTGIGISPQAQAKLFTPFTQANAGSSRRFEGTGLGLSIVKRLLEAMGGHIDVDSRPGRGTAFRFSLPLARQTGGSAHRAPGDGRLHGDLQFAVVHPDDTVRDPLVALATSLGWKTEAFASPLALLNGAAVWLRRAADSPHVLALPTDPSATESGLTDLATQLAASAGKGKPAVLLGLCEGSAGDAAAAQAVDPRLAGTLSLPATAASLFDTVIDAVTRTERWPAPMPAHRRHPAAAPALDSALDGLRVLVVDDSDVNLEIARGMLEKAGAEVVCATHGGAALDLLGATGEHFDAVLMDIQMPGMDGIEASQRIHDLPPYGNLPILALSAGVLREERQRARDAGMVGFLPKPFERGDLIQAVARMARRGDATDGASGFNLRDAQPAPAAAPTTPAVVAAKARPPGPPRGPTASAWPVLPGIDIEKAQRWTSGDLALFQMALAQVVAEFDGPANTMRHRGETAPAELAAQLHKLRGALGVIGAVRLHDRAARVEQALRDDDPDWAAHLDALQAEWRQLRPPWQAHLATVAAHRPVDLPGDSMGLSTTAPAAWREELVGLLQRNDLAALTCVEQCPSPQALGLPTAEVDALVQAVRELRFADALALLARSAPTPAAPL